MGKRYVWKPNARVEGIGEDERGVYVDLRCSTTFVWPDGSEEVRGHNATHRLYVGDTVHDTYSLDVVEPSPHRIPRVFPRSR